MIAGKLRPGVSSCFPVGDLGLHANFVRTNCGQKRPRECARHCRRRLIRKTVLESRRLLAAHPIITEFLASNDSSLLDGNGMSSDWIEIFNPGDQPIDQAHWSLSRLIPDLIHPNAMHFARTAESIPPSTLGSMAASRRRESPSPVTVADRRSVESVEAMLLDTEVERAAQQARADAESAKSEADRHLAEAKTGFRVKSKFLFFSF